jgi:hypothetical protein
MELVSGFCFAVWLDKITEVSLERARYGAEKKLPPPESRGF